MSNEVSHLLRAAEGGFATWLPEDDLQTLRFLEFYGIRFHIKLDNLYILSCMILQIMASGFTYAEEQSWLLWQHWESNIL